jgi:hypothetical protein
MISRFFTLTSRATLMLLLAGSLSAQDRAPVEPSSLPAPDQPMAPVEPVIRKLDEFRIQIGGVTLDQRTREIRFPAEINMKEGLLEFLIVHTKGKIHESLLVTDISPTHLNLAFMLLRYKASPELYPIFEELGVSSGKFPEVDEATRVGARILIDVEWEQDGKMRRMPVNDMIQHAVKAQAIPAGPWVYGGSVVHDGKYSAEVTGDIAAIFLSASAMINYPGEGNNDDTIWIPFPKRVPDFGTKVTVIIAPFDKAATPAKP